MAHRGWNVVVINYRGIGGVSITVIYLGGEGVNPAIVGAAAICNPWDILLCDRFLHRRLVQTFYDRALAIGLKDYAQLHQAIFSRLTDWEAIAKLRSVRDFDHHATRVLAKLELHKKCDGSPPLH